MITYCTSRVVSHIREIMCTCEMRVRRLCIYIKKRDSIAVSFFIYFQFLFIFLFSFCFNPSTQNSDTRQTLRRQRIYTGGTECIVLYLKLK